VKRKEVACLDENGGEVSASSYDREHEKPENAFREGDDRWSSRILKDKNKVEEHILRKWNTPVSPVIIGMQALDSSCAPTKFQLVGQEEGKDEWVKLLEAEGVQWQSYQWKFWVVEGRRRVTVVKVMVEEKDGGGHYVYIRNIRLFI
jgi:hypothetical protein